MPLLHSAPAKTVEVNPLGERVTPLSGAELMAANPYRPWPARITSITDLTATEKLFEFRLIDEAIREAFRHEPGQFVELSIFGVGEAPISISSSPSKHGFIELCVRRTGRFTEVLHTMQCGDIVGIRGPFGRGFPFEQMKGHDILLVAGGLGIAPLRSAHQQHPRRAQRVRQGHHHLRFEEPLRGDVPRPVRDVAPPQGLRPVPDRRPSRRRAWDGEVGLVTKPFEHLELDARHTFGAVCGPPVMYRFVIDEMRKKGIELRPYLLQLRASYEVRHG